MPKFIGHASAYAYAKSKGYTGTEAEFAELMASYAHVAEDAQASAESAAASAQSAVESKTAAQTAAGTATTKASEASQSAQAAESAKQTAVSKATQAASSADAAGTSEINAKASETAASASATTASTKASEASQSATDAQTAQASAESAQADAEDARDAAQASAQSIEASAEQIQTNADDIGNLKSGLNSVRDVVYTYMHSESVEDIDTIATMCARGEILKYMDYGDQISPEWVEGSNTYTPAWNLCHEGDAELEDAETIHGAYWEWDKTTPTGVPFDEPEAIAYFTGEEYAGNWYIEIKAAYGDGWIVGQCINFRLTDKPAAGDQLVIDCGKNNANNPTASINWYVFAKGGTEVKQSGQTSNGTTGTKFGETSSVDGHHTNGNVNAPSRIVYGYNRWSQSALRQRLNSTGAAGTWWTAQNDWDRPPAVASTLDGFLHGYADDVVRHFKPVKVVTVACNADENVEDVTYDRVFLSSLEQMYCAPQFSGKEGEYWEYYKRLLGRTTPAPTSKTYTRLIKYALNAPTSAQYCWRRSAFRNYANTAWLVTNSGYVSTTNAYYANRCAPSVFLSE